MLSLRIYVHVSLPLRGKAAAKSRGSQAEALRVRIPSPALNVKLFFLGLDDVLDVDEVKLAALVGVGRVNANPAFVSAEAGMGVHAPFAFVFRR